MASKVMNISAALDFIKDGDSIAISAVGIVGYPEYIVAKLEERYVERRFPGGLTPYAAGGHGNSAVHCLDSRFAHPGFLKRHVHTLESHS